ncbi:MAG: hypothetical protein IKW27_03010 [Bacteroidales bacterium]|nr:hypothetical protein [Bacteroidales bacterium]
MGMLCLILYITAAALWFFTSEYSSAFGVYWPTCAMRGRDFDWLVFVSLLVALWLSSKGIVEESVYEHIGLREIDCRSMIVMLMSSFIVLITLKFFTIKGSVVYALLGSLGACWARSKGGDVVDWHFILSFIAAPVMSFALSAGLRFFFRLVFSRVHIHMITLSFYMRQVVILCIILTACAVGYNWGGLLCGIGDMMRDETTVVLTALAAVGAVMLLYMKLGKGANSTTSGIFVDFSIYAVISVGFAVAATLLFFSFEWTTSLLYLAPVPLSMSTLVMAAVAGSEVAQKSRLVDNEEYVKEAISATVVPAGAFILAYLLLSIIGEGPEDAMVGFIVMSTAILALLALAFAGYARRQRMNREATDRIVYAQRQQIYEHSRALSDMELKVVLSENQALHNAVEMKRQEVMNVALSIVEQREFLESLSDMIKNLEKSEDAEVKDRLISELSLAIRQRLSYDRDVDSQYFYAQAESLHEDFSAKLSENFPNLTQQERRLATLLRLGFSSKYIASLMNITPKSVEISRYRLRQKLNLDKGDNLVNFIKSI